MAFTFRNAVKFTKFTQMELKHPLKWKQIVSGIFFSLTIHF